MLQFPTSKQLRDAMIDVLKGYPNGLRTDEIDRLVADFLNLTDTQRSQLRSGNRTEQSYRLAWERTHDKKSGILIRIGARTWKIAN